MERLSIREEFAQKILVSMTAGIPPPWRDPFNRGFPTNPLTGRKYGGINPIMLSSVAALRTYRSKYWATYTQWRGVGMQVDKGQHGVPIINWKSYTKGVHREGLIRLEKFKRMEVHKVFNAEQVFGPEIGKYLITINENNANTDYKLAEAVIKATGAKISHLKRCEVPIYERPPKDRIVLPKRERFLDDPQYFNTVLHELMHWSEWRTAWLGTEDLGELIAEIGTGYLASELGVPHCNDLTSYEKWLPTWVEKIEKNPKYLFDAAAQAARGVDLVLGFHRQQEREAEPEGQEE